MLRLSIKRQALFRAVIDMLYAGWTVEDMRGHMVTLRPPFLPHPYRQTHVGR